MYINMKPSKQLVNRLVKETLEQKYTCAKESWESMIEDLSKDIKKPITLDDAGNYNVCECEPYHISLRPIVHDIFDVLAYRDTSDRTKKLFMKYEDVKKFVKEYLKSDTKNYVDSALAKGVENSKDKQGGKKADAQSEKEENVVDPIKGFKIVKDIKVEKMNDPKDDPTQPMQAVGKFAKQGDHKPKKSEYVPPTLPKNLQKLVVKYTKAGKAKKK
jgi:hypothetical protein